MPMIQIEQDSAELIAEVRAQIANMVERMRKMPGTVVVAMADEFVRRYLSTALADLLDHTLGQCGYHLPQ
ncbi:hypothetical protein [Pseudomonas zeae]|uniref:hypothetical protein n=1 Tax=Pseudomonas zeae TaxID=2745510 RepID=UPI0039E05DB9